MKAQFAVLCGIGLFAFISYNLVRMPVLSLFAQSLGARPEAIGFIVAASTLTGVFLKWPAGALSDLYDRRWLLLVGLLAFALPPFCYPLVTDVPWLIALRFVHGLATAVFGPIGLAVVADVFREARGVALGSYTAATQAGAMLGPLLGGWLLLTGGFSAAFVTAGTLGVVAVLLFFLMRLPPITGHVNRESLIVNRREDVKRGKYDVSRITNNAVRPPGPAAVIRDMARGARTVLGNVRVVVTSATDGARQVANGALMAFLPIYVVGIGLNAAQAGVLFGVQSVTSFASRPTMGWASDRIGRRPLILLGLVVCAGSLAAIPFTTSFVRLMALSALFGFGEAIVNASAAALVADLSELKTLGSAMGLQGAITDIGHASGPILSGVLIGALGFQLAFSILAGFVLVAAGVFRASVGAERPVGSAS
ncbi:MAG: MFS transporter [Nitrospirae bacterium]|nr:MAG: MFS transporter [Nitrospirota bacterium]